MNGTARYSGTRSCNGFVVSRQTRTPRGSENRNQRPVVTSRVDDLRRNKPRTQSMLQTMICSIHVMQRPGEWNQASIAEHTIQARRPRERFTGLLCDLRCTDLQTVPGTRLKIRSASCMAN